MALLHCVTLPVLHGEGVAEAVLLVVVLKLTVTVGVGVVLPLELAQTEPDTDRDMVPLLHCVEEAVAQTDKLRVALVQALRLGVEVAETVPQEVALELTVPVRLTVLLGEALREGETVALPHSVTLPVLHGEGVAEAVLVVVVLKLTVTVGVGVVLPLELTDTEPDTVLEVVPLLHCVEEAVAQADRLPVALAQTLRLGVEVTESVPLVVELALRVPLRLPLVHAVALRDKVLLALRQAVALAVEHSVGDRLLLALPEMLTVRVGVAVWLTVREELTLGEDVDDEVTQRVMLRDCVRVPEAVLEGDEEGVTVMLGLRDWLGLEDREGEALGQPETLTLRVRESAPLPLREALPQRVGV